jgi:hypothetical protein
LAQALDEVDQQEEEERCRAFLSLQVSCTPMNPIATVGKDANGANEETDRRNDHCQNTERVREKAFRNAADYQCRNEQKLLPAREYQEVLVECEVIRSPDVEANALCLSHVRPSRSCVQCLQKVAEYSQFQEWLQSLCLMA